jgi:uracil-DNA glycosylase family 4
MDKAIALNKVNKAMEADKHLPLVKSQQDIIPGDGNPNAEIVFIGEAGGYYESIQRKPFVGAAGKLLNQMLASINLSRKDVYITNMVKARPPDNRDPLPDELKKFEKYLNEELKIIKPKLVVTLGRFSMAKFLPSVKITQVHGKLYKREFGDRSLFVIPMFHPAAALRAPAVTKMFTEDFLKLPRALQKIKSL